MNDEILKLAIKHNVLNYVDNETPTYYFVDGNVDIDDINDFALDIIKTCCRLITSSFYDGNYDNSDNSSILGVDRALFLIKNHFSVEE